MTNTVEFTLFTDAGHGWARVPHQVVKELGLADQISEYSYQDSDYVYLEEDCDLHLLLDEYKNRGQTVRLVEHYDDYSPIRALPSYETVV